MSFYNDMPFFVPRQPTHYGPGMMQTPQQGSMTPLSPTGQAMVPTPQTTAGTPSDTSMSPQYVAGFLKSQIGRNVRVEFLIGTTGPLIDRVGTLVGVGTSYILLRPIDSDDVLMADLYSIKFVTVLL